MPRLECPGGWPNLVNMTEGIDIVGKYEKWTCLGNSELGDSSLCFFYVLTPSRVPLFFLHPVSCPSLRPLPPSHLVFYLFFILHSLVPFVSKMASTPEMPPETSLPFGVFSPPRDAYEWKKALADVKWLCFNQQYKQCAMRCNQLIETASSPVCASFISSLLITNGLV